MKLKNHVYNVHKGKAKSNHIGDFEDGVAQMRHSKAFLTAVCFLTYSQKSF